MRLLRTILALFCFLVALLLAQGAGATTYYVREDGGAANKAAATSCGAAASAMTVATHNGDTFSAGDTICFCTDGGAFATTEITVPSSGSSGSNIVYDGDCDGDGTKASLTGSSTVRNVYVHDVEFVTVQNFDGNGAETITDGIFAYSETGGVLEGIKILNNTFYRYNQHGVVVTGEDASNYVDGIEIAYNTIHDIGTDTADNDIGIAGYTTNAWIHNNTLYGSETAGVDGVICAYCGAGNVVERNTIYNHNGTGFGEDGIDWKYSEAGYRTGTETSAWNELRYNTIYGHTLQTGITVNFDSDNTRVYGNTIYDNGTGIWVAGRTDGQVADETDIHHNIIYSNDTYGITVSRLLTADVTDCRIYNNTIVQNGGESGGGLNLSWCSAGCIVKNNIFDRNRPGTSSFRAQVIVSTDADDTAVFDNNLYYHDTATVRIYWDGGYRTLAVFQDTYSQEAAGKEANPLFTAPASGRFDLKPLSPAINAGTDVSLTSDFRGLGLLGLPDLGALEYHPPQRSPIRIGIGF